MNIDNTFPTNLCEGDFESIILLGSDAQSRLRESSRMIFEMILNKNEEIEVVLNQIVLEINQFQRRCEHKSPFYFCKENYRNRLIKQYNRVIVYMDQVTVALQLQEAQLLKDNRLFQEMEGVVDACSKELDGIIKSSTEWLQNNQCNGSHFLRDEEEVSITSSWTERLSKRIEDLKISHTVANQTLAQLQIMCENNNILVEKIISTISGTIPIWRNQVSLLLGLEKLNRNNSMQQKITELTNKYLKENDNRF